MKSILHVGLAVLLTPAVFIVMSCLDPLTRLVGSDFAWAAWARAFRLLGVVGNEGEENLLLAVLLTISFAIAAVIVLIASTLMQRIGAGRAAP